MPTFTNYDALNDFIFEDMKKQIKEYIDTTDYIDPENCVWEQHNEEIVDNLTDWTCFPSFEINFDFPQFAILINKLNDTEQLTTDDFNYTDAKLTNSVLSCIYNQNIFELDEYATALCEEKQIIMRREIEERNERLEAEYRERSGEQIRDIVTRAHARGGLRAIQQLLKDWCKEDMDDIRFSFIKENVEIACDRLGIEINFWRVNKKEQEFIENFKKTTMGVIEVMLEKIDEKKQNMKEYDYMEYMKHLKMAWELVEEVQSKERVLIVKEIVNDFWKGISQNL
jgi:hypothetical protein